MGRKPNEKGRKPNEKDGNGTGKDGNGTGKDGNETGKDGNGTGKDGNETGKGGNETGKGGLSGKFHRAEQIFQPVEHPESAVVRKHRYRLRRPGRWHSVSFRPKEKESALCQMPMSAIGVFGLIFTNFSCFFSVF